MNILITKNKNIKFLFKIYYLIALLIVLSVLMSLIMTNSFYQKSNITKNIFLNITEQNNENSYNGELYKVKSLKQNNLIYDFHIDQIKETKTIQI